MAIESNTLFKLDTDSNGLARLWVATTRAELSKWRVILRRQLEKANGV
ncbi:MAG: hypothetical protein R2867_19730 [Caldilineaceae bacterium]